MILVLTNGEHRVWIDVALMDGCEVRVGNVTVDRNVVDPNTWYKVCLIDYLTVNVKSSTLAWVIDAPLMRSQSPSLMSLPSAGTGSQTSHSHDSGCGDETVGVEGTHLATISEKTSSSQTSLDSGNGGYSAGRRAYLPETSFPIGGQASSTLPRHATPTSSFAFAGANMDDDEPSIASSSTGRHRRSLSDAALKETKEQADFLARFSNEKGLSSNFHSSTTRTHKPNEPNESSLNSASGSSASFAATGGGGGSGSTCDRSSCQAIAIPKLDDEDGQVTAMESLLTHEQVLNLNDLLASLENNLDYDTSVVYDIFNLCETLLQEVVGKAAPVHARWIEEQYAYGRLINEVKHVEQLIQILHSHLLPFISVQRGDRLVVEWALQQQQDTISAISEDMLQQSMQETSLASSVDSLLTRVLPGVEASLSDHIYNREFLQQLYSDIDNRGLLRKAGRTLDDLQSEINVLKRKIEDQGTGSTGEQERTLLRLRDRRDSAHTYLTELLRAREIIAPHLHRTGPNTGNLLPAQRSYLQACKVLEEHRRRTAELLDKKVVGLGIREALQEALHRLDNDCADGGEDAAASLLGSPLPKSGLLTASLSHAQQGLLPLRETVHTVLSNGSDAIGQKHHQFHMEIIAICNETAMPNILAFGVPRVGSVVVSDVLEGTSGRQHVPGLHRAKSSYEIIDPARENVDEVATRITEHTESVVSQLLEYFPRSSEQIHRKLHLTYEGALFNKIGRTIDDLYTVWSQRIVNQLLRVTEFVENVTFPQLILHLRFPEGWWRSLFEEPADPKPEDRRGAVFSATAPVAPFQRILAPAAAALHRLTGTLSPLHKAELLTKAIQHITRSLGDYHGKVICGKPGASQVGSDDLVPVVILFILYCKPEVIAALCMNCLLLEDLCPEFLRNGMHGFSMVQFQGAMHVIANVLPTEELNPANSEGMAATAAGGGVA